MLLRLRISAIGTIVMGSKVVTPTGIEPVFQP